jgi:hypothetical protein
MPAAKSGVLKTRRPRKTAKGNPEPPEDRSERETVIHMKGSAEYVAWLDDVHRKTHIPKVQIFRLAIAEWAERNGHPTPPEI